MRRSALVLLVALALALLSGGAGAQRGHWPAVLDAALSESGVPREAVALYVQQVGAAEPLLSWNADRAMSPASTMKLVTTLAALEMLGPAYTWRTEAYALAEPREGALEGDLFLKGYGDPRLTLENFWLLLRDLRSRGVRDIRGDLVLDRSFFALDPADPGRFDGEATRPYNVLPDALLLNFKSVRLQFVPQEKLGSVKILASPALPELDIVNQLALGAGTCDFWPDRPQMLPDGS